MNLASFLSPDQILLDMRADEHLPAIEELVDHLVLQGMLPVAQRDEVFESLRRREEQVSTGIGYGVAIPHAFSDHVGQVLSVFGRSRAGIDFEALDNSPVHFVMLFIVPRRDYSQHLRTLAAIARMFTKCEIRQHLADARCRTDILKILAGNAAEGGG